MACSRTTMSPQKRTKAESCVSSLTAIATPLGHAHRRAAFSCGELRFVRVVVTVPLNIQKSALEAVPTALASI
ncbi:hypothetical protein OH76DRAFT_767811 [Lentinus brumalis]|uniref:Uncharacterized protein n=1 Tax=Lentinus brumalis TaxID=2498619 RepID=A0A371D4L7_9APHY|nr:hypothetical protein OH76DRAFT_767811 [Polyporus brumalis]